jgi:exodeoxyribonuclease VII small subunit
VNKKPSSPDTAPSPNFEEALGDLEKIVRRLEGDGIGLNDALASYEQGVKLLRQCYQLLESAERKIELLSGVDAEGNPVCAPVEDEALSLDEKAQRRSRRRSSPASNTPADRGQEEGDSDMDVPGGLF